jgi:hypothetical protein
MPPLACSHGRNQCAPINNLDLPPGQSRPGYSEFLNTPLTEAEFASNPSRCKKLLLLFKKNIR